MARTRLAIALPLVLCCVVCVRCRCFLPFPDSVLRSGVRAAAPVAGLATTSFGSSLIAHASILVDAADSGDASYTGGAESSKFIIIQPTGTPFDYVVGFFIVAFIAMNSPRSSGEWVPFASPGTKFLQSIRGDDSIMNAKIHGTCPKIPTPNLRWGVDHALADRICCFSRTEEESAGYFSRYLSVLQTDKAQSPAGRITFYDSVTGKPLFIAPRGGRSFEEFVAESTEGGWLAFRDDDVIRQNVRVLLDGEVVSVDGTHLGRNTPDFKGNRYCVNIVSVSGLPPES